MPIRKFFLIFFASVVQLSCTGLSEQKSLTEPKTLEKQEAVYEQVIIKPAELPRQNTEALPIQTPKKPLSPAVLALLNDAKSSSENGNLDSAVVSVERALNIEPRNAHLTYQLALFRLKQEKPRLAEDLAKKAALLAGADKSLKNRAWILIAQARQAQGNQKGANQARVKASSFQPD